MAVVARNGFVARPQSVCGRLLGCAAASLLVLSIGACRAKPIDESDDWIKPTYKPAVLPLTFKPVFTTEPNVSVPGMALPDDDPACPNAEAPGVDLSKPKP